MTHVFTPPDECPVCGEAVPRNAKACPGCGADERSGWDETAAVYDGLDLPDEDSSQKHSPSGKRPLWISVAIALLALLIVLSLFRF